MSIRISDVPDPLVRRRPRTLSPIVLLGASTIVLYLINHWIQSSIAQDGALPVSAMSTVVAEHAAPNPRLRWHLVAYLLVNCGLFYGYVRILARTRRGEFDAPRVKSWAIAVPCFINVMLGTMAPSLSQDIYSYMAHGFLGVTAGGNPLLQPAFDVARYAFGDRLAGLGWHGRVAISPYGILWTRIEVAALFVAGNDVRTALLILKAAVVTASLGSAGLIWTLLGRLRPSVQLLGTLMYLWNPLIIVEIAGEGHNDSVMVFFVLAALAACVGNRPVVSGIAMLLAVLTKYVPVLFIPSLLIYEWHRRRRVARLLYEVTAVAIVGLAVAAALYGDLWAGVHSFDGLLNRGQPSGSASPLGAANWLLRHSPWSARSGALSLLLVVLPTLAFMAWVSLQARTEQSLARSWAWVALAYVLVASPGYWPWYSVMPIALIAVADAAEWGWLVLLMSAVGRLCAPLDVLYDHGYVGNWLAKGALTGLGATLPVVVIVLVAYRRRSPWNLPNSPTVPPGS